MENTIKYHLIILLALFVSCSNGTQTKSQTTSIILSDSEIDLGKVKINTLKESEFTITNVGNVHLTIYQMATSCGCTEVEWTQKPIKPSKSTTIKLKYYDKYPGFFHKTITIYANTDKPVEVKIKGELIE